MARAGIPPAFQLATEDLDSGVPVLRDTHDQMPWSTVTSKSGNPGLRSSSVKKIVGEFGIDPAAGRNTLACATWFS